MVAVKASEVDRAVKSRRPEIAVLLFYGSDSGRVSERARAAAEAAASDPADPFSLVRLDGDLLSDEPVRLVEEVATFGMFGGRKAVWVRPTSRNIAPAVAACLDAPPGDTLVVVEAGDLSRGAPLRALCEASPRALALPSYADEARDVGQLVADMLAEHGLRIGGPARQLLVESLGGDRLASRGEIEKLALYAAGQAEVGIEDVEAVVSDVSAMAVDSAIDAAFLGQVAALDESLSQLEAHAVAPGQIMALALRHAVQLLAATAAREEAGSTEEGLRTWRGLHFRRRAAVARQVETWGAGRTAEALARIQAAMLETRRMPALAGVLAGRALMAVAETARRGSRRA